MPRLCEIVSCLPANPAAAGAVLAALRLTRAECAAVLGVAAAPAHVALVARTGELEHYSISCDLMAKRLNAAEDEACVEALADWAAPSDMIARSAAAPRTSGPADLTHAAIARQLLVRGVPAAMYARALEPSQIRFGRAYGYTPAARVRRRPPRRARRLAASDAPRPRPPWPRGSGRRLRRARAPGRAGRARSGRLPAAIPARPALGRDQPKRDAGRGLQLRRTRPRGLFGAWPS